MWKEFNNLECSNTCIMICLDIFIVGKSKYPVAHTDLYLRTTCYIHLVEIYFSSLQHVSVPLSTSIYSESKVNIFKGDMWFESAPIVYNMDFVGHKFKVVVKLCT